ncbi:unnamed protein product [Peronospora belbahrii]|uniref:CRC domain-containing protein n=1 Tax=Peronospora belbahrii TaxID=622444 RepID=A0AAU9L4I8_9STRA|nr:unnamed protein product [Peronospora belbahrii]CAH0521962.1 unnamed protein product [Peronospora belbahrii]
MDHCSTITFHQALSCCSSDTKENEEPVDVRITAKDSVSAIKASVNKQITTPSSTKGTINRKDRRALHDVDNNCPRVQVHSPSCSQLNSSSCVSKDAIEAKKVQVQSTSSKQALHEADKTVEGLVKGHKRSVVAVDDDENSYTDSSSRLDHLESENLAWMDMMLALLEKRYDANFALPVCLTDLEAANVLQLPQRKRLKTGIASAQVKSKRGLDTTRRQTTFTNAFNNSKMPATKVHQASEQLNERKRQRLILRHAQQIQASTVSSSTSCGCKTGCLKMYCLCFSSRGFCHARCTCDDCKNNRMNQTGRVEAIQNYIANDPRAFSYALLPQDTNNTSGFLHLLPQVWGRFQCA